MPHNPEGSSSEPGRLSGRSLAAMRQVYELAKKDAPGFSFDTIPEEQLFQFRAEDEQTAIPPEDSTSS